VVKPFAAHSSPKPSGRLPGRRFEATCPIWRARGEASVAGRRVAPRARPLAPAHQPGDRSPLGRSYTTPRQVGPARVDLTKTLRVAADLEDDALARRLEERR
jgi:hypothetical protein